MVLMDEKRLKEYGIEDGDNLTCIIRMTVGEVGWYTKGFTDPTKVDSLRYATTIDSPD